MRKPGKKTIKKLIISVLLVVVALLFILLFKNFPRFFFPWYRGLSATVLNVLSTLTGFVPFSLWDILAVILGSGLIVLLVKKRIADVVLILSALFCFAVFGWLLNHYAPPLAENFGLTIEPSSKMELEAATSYYLDKAVEYSYKVDRDDYDFYELAEIAGNSYKGLDGFPKGSTARVKRFSLIGEYLMYNGVVGMFMPLTAEASVPYTVPKISLGSTMAHEAAHRLGIASEQEANFAAFIACVNSEDVRMVYSGYYEAFTYCYNSLHGVDKNAAVELYIGKEGAELLRADIEDARKIYSKYDSPLQEVQDKINDTYLKTFGQESGVMSYGEVTDYLIAYYLHNVCNNK